MVRFGKLNGHEVALFVTREGAWGAEGALVDGRAAWLDFFSGVITLD